MNDQFQGVVTGRDAFLIWVSLFVLVWLVGLAGLTWILRLRRRGRTSLQNAGLLVVGSVVAAMVALGVSTCCAAAWIRAL